MDIDMNENTAKFFELYKSDPALRERIAQAEAAYPGSLEIRDAVVPDVLLPIAQELGLPFTLMELKVYETKLKVERHPDTELTEAELALPDRDDSYFLIDRGWAYERDAFSPQEDVAP